MNAPAWTTERIALDEACAAARAEADRATRGGSVLDRALREQETRWNDDDRRLRAARRAA